MELIKNCIFIMLSLPVHTSSFHWRHIVSKNLSSPLDDLADQVILVCIEIFLIPLLIVPLNPNRLNSLKIVILDWTWTLTISILSVFLVR